MLLTAAVLAECNYVLMSVYNRARADVVDALSAFVQRGNIRLVGIEKSLAVAALHMCRDSGRVKIVDALLWAKARSSGITTIYTFDGRFPLEGVNLRGIGWGNAS